MDILPKNKTLQYAFIVLAAVFNLNLWSFSALPDVVYNVLQMLTMAAFIVVVLWNSHVFTKTEAHFKANVLLFLFIPFLSAFGAYIYHHQSFRLSITLLRPSFLWLFYFVLHTFKIEKKKVIKLMIVIGCVWAFLTIVQQFTYPHIYFFRLGDEDGGTGEDSSIYRAGVYRFMIPGQQYGLFVLLYFFYKYLNTKSNRKINYLPFILLSLLGFYYFGTRQYALTAVLCLGVAVLLLKPGLRSKYITIGIPMLLLIWALKNILFSQYIELTSRQEQYGWDQDIRVLCAKFYLFDYWPHWTAMIIGNGPPHMLSDYGKEMELILAYFHFHRSDVGLIGAFNNYGILYVLLVFWTIGEVTLLRSLAGKDKYLKLFFYNALFIVLLGDAFARGMLFFCFIFYLIDKSIEERKQERILLEEDIYATPELDYT